jgi:hypothetical protein
MEIVSCVLVFLTSKGHEDQRTMITMTIWGPLDHGRHDVHEDHFVPDCHDDLGEHENYVDLIYHEDHDYYGHDYHEDSYYLLDHNAMMSMISIGTMSNMVIIRNVINTKTMKTIVTMI